MDNKLNYLFKADYYKYLDLSILAIIGYSIYLLIEKTKIPKKITEKIKFIWLIKLLFIAFIIPLYEINFSTDSDQYFRAAVYTDYYSEKYKYNAYHFPNYFSNTFLIILIKLVNFFTFNSWFALKLFLGILYLKIIIDFCQIYFFYNKKYPTLSVFIIAFMPSLLLYSQLILKDIFIIFLLSHIFKEIIFSRFSMKNLNYIKIVFLVLASATIFFLRSWVFYSLFLAFISALLVNSNFFKNLKKYIYKNFVKSLFFLTFFYFVFLIFFDQIFKEIFIEVFRQKILITGNPEENLNYDALYGVNNFSELLMRYPYLLFKSYFNPFLKEILNIKYTLFVFENLLILVLLLVSYKDLFRNYKINSLLINFVLILGILYSVNNFINSGMAIRYSLQYKIFLIFSCFYYNPKIENYLISLYNTIDNKRKNYSRKYS